MKFRTLILLLKEGIFGVWINKIMGFAAIMITAACMFVSGSFFIVSENIPYIIDQIKSKYEILIFLSDNLNDVQIKSIEDRIKSNSKIKSCNYISKEMRLKNLAENLGEDSELLKGYEEDNPLRDSFSINLNDISESLLVIQEIQNIEGVEKITNSQETIDKILVITSFLKSVFFWATICLNIVLVFTIFNVIKLTVFARRREIEIMRYVGATNHFIRFPFLVEGVFVTFIGCMIAYFVILSSYNVLHLYVKENLSFLVLIKKPEEFYSYLFFIYLGLSFFIGLFGSIVSTGKYIKV